jgi:hypothetical protein
MGYCSMMNDLFAKNTENRPLSLSPSFDATTKRLRRLYSRRKPSQLSDAYPNDLNIEVGLTCICASMILTGFIDMHLSEQYRVFTSSSR